MCILPECKGNWYDLQITKSFSYNSWRQITAECQREFETTLKKMFGYLLV